MDLKPLKIGPVMSGSRPLIVGVVDRVYPLMEFELLYHRGVTMLELRLDLFDDLPLQKVMDFFKAIEGLGKFALLGTLRETDRNRLIRPLLFEALLPYVDMVDIEVDSNLAHSFVKIARQAHKLVLISDHWYTHMPSQIELKQFWASALSFSPDMVKLAAQAHTHDDAMRLLEFCYHHSPICPMVAIAMGESGRFSRIVGGYFRSYLTYGYLGDVPAAPGQFSVKDIAQRMASLPV